MYRLFTMLAFSFLTLTSSAHAQDEGLYAPVAPDGSAFFRFIHANNTEEAQEVEIKANNKSYGTQNYKNISDYFVSKKGNVKFTVADYTAEQELEADKYYSILVTTEGLTVVEDQPLENMSKALLTFYNLSSTNSLTLKTAEKDIEIIKDVEQNANKSREINAVKLDLAVTDGANQSMKLDPVVLTRKNAYAIIALTDADGALDAVVETSKTDTTK